MDSFLRGGGKNPVILADRQGIEHALSEHGARMVGREYELLPVYQRAGVFHPKVSAFINTEDAHLLVGSGNLTFGGWGGNAELVEHFHSDNAPRLIEDCADFLELLATGDVAEVAAQETVMTFAHHLRHKVQGKPDTGRLRLAHNAGQTIAEQLREEADRLGGAMRICIAAPFYDANGAAISKLRESLSCDEIWGYVHSAGQVQGTRSSNWPHGQPNCLRAANFDMPWASDPRRLHAKAIEVVCRSGRLVFSGSANATVAGLFGPNSEAGVLRIFPDSQRAWAITPSSPPPKMDWEEHAEEELTGENASYVISAELKGEKIAGHILGPWPQPEGNLFCEIAGELIELGPVAIEPSGAFQISSKSVAELSWQTGRIVLTILADEDKAAGFLSVKAITELTRKTGAAGARILAILSGTETPSDVAAIISWFHEDPERMPRALAGARGDGEAGPVVEQTFNAAAFDVHDKGLESGTGAEGHRHAGYTYTMRALLDAFRKSRGPFNEEAWAAKDRGELDTQAEKDLARDEKKNELAIGSFEQLLSYAMAAENGGAHGEPMLALAHYLTDRLRPPAETVLGWLDRIERGLVGGLEGEFAKDLVTLSVIEVANSPGRERLAKARRLLIRHELVSGLASPDLDRLGAIASTLPLQIKLDEALVKLASARIAAEELERLLSIPTEHPLPSFPELETHVLWPRLRQLHEIPEKRSRLQCVVKPVSSCPSCHIGLSSSAAEDLRLTGVSRCDNRCNRLIAVVRETDDEA